MKLSDFDFHIKVNSTEHHTAEFDMPETLIVRRGQKFSVTLTFSRDFNKETDKIILQFTTGMNDNNRKLISIYHRNPQFNFSERDKSALIYSSSIKHDRVIHLNVCGISHNNNF